MRSGLVTAVVSAAAVFELSVAAGARGAGIGAGAGTAPGALAALVAVRPVAVCTSAGEGDRLHVAAEDTTRRTTRTTKSFFTPLPPRWNILKNLLLYIL
jgi:hypothetical protein